MSDYDRGAYAPPSDAPLAFDARDPRERRPFPLSLVLGIVVLAVLGGALALLYRGGVRQADTTPPVVGQPVGALRTAPDTPAAPADPSMRLDVYEDRDAAPAGVEPIGPEPTFAPAPEEPISRPAPLAAAPVAPAVVAPTAPVAAPAPVAPSAVSPSPAIAAPVAPRAPAPAPVAAPRPVVAPAATQAAPAASSGSISVQIGAFSSDAIARSQLAAAAATGPTRVEAVQRNGATLHRGIVSGFASRSEAQAYCAQRRSAGGDCIVR